MSDWGNVGGKFGNGMLEDPHEYLTTTDELQKFVLRQLLVLPSCSIVSR